MHAAEAEAAELALGVVHAVDEGRCAVALGQARAVHVGHPRTHPPLAARHVQHGTGVGGGRRGVEQQVVGDQLVARGQGDLIARPVRNLAQPQAGLEVTERDRHRGLVHDGAAVEQCTGTALGREGEPPAGAAFGFLLQVQHGHAEVGVVVGVACAAAVQEDKGTVVLIAVVDVGRVDQAADLQALEALVGKAVLQSLGLDGDAVELAHLLRRHAPLARRCGRGRGRRHTLFKLGHAVAQGAQLFQQLFVALRSRGESCCKGQGQGGRGDESHGRFPLDGDGLCRACWVWAALGQCRAVAISRLRRRSWWAMK